MWWTHSSTPAASRFSVRCSATEEQGSELPINREIGEVREHLSQSTGSSGRSGASISINREVGEIKEHFLNQQRVRGDQRLLLNQPGELNRGFRASISINKKFGEIRGEHILNQQGD
jgi:hypothetical protein